MEIFCCYELLITGSFSLLQCNGLDLCTSILYPAIPLAKVQHLKEIPDSEDMPARYQQIILGTYAEHAMYQYNKQFGTRYELSL